MVIAAYTAGDGKNGIMIGISAENVKRLKEGKPIKLDLRQLPLVVDGTIGIMYGETEQAIADELREFIGPDTKVNISDKLEWKL